ncbi:sodium:solute symporter family transporter [Synoicihabitans lomoniglobus]|uniref:Sodium/solute symporter n=1 Tax=Synoicihabitans lomoniglobus TaxID=2909285 RepID=A0AAE9ZXB8_9BACT|nr:sodium/solute symporter [Opitutaceae bacterium LMO-M01]WED64814.1 sodium/solute symporter [Opitutaceae bacterium LMO-M01]
MQSLDWIILTLYLGAMIGLSLWLARGQEDEHDYYVGGRKLSWWAVGISIVATQSSAISFVSIPAFVALRPGGGLTWLQYELAVPLAMLFLLVFLVPYLRALSLVSVFEFLRVRFGAPTGKALAIIFLLSRGLATGIGVYATGLVLAPMLEWSLTSTLLLIGVVAVIYDTIGGIKAVVASDVVQLALMMGGVIFAIGLACAEVGGAGAAWEALGAERRTAVDWSTGIGDGATAPFWAFLVGGFFLYASYYGTDQSQVQRLLSTSSPREAQKAVLLGGLLRLPLTLLYVALGVAIGAVFALSPELQAAVPADKLDALVPQFILLYVPAGFKGLILAAILAAAMSSVDSALNSLSAVTMRDFVTPLLKPDTPHHLRWSKITTLAWGVLVTGAAFLAGGIDRTVIEAINKIGSAFYGPVLATFLLGIFTRRARGKAMLIGVLAGVAANMLVWISGWPVHWMWWNVLGCAVTVVTALSGDMVWKQANDGAPKLPLASRPDREVGWAAAALLAAFGVTLALVVGLH